MNQRSRLSEHARRWNVELGADVVETPRAILSFGTRDGDPVVLKVPRHGAGETASAAALRHFGERAAVRVIAHADEGVVLLERAIPGGHLTDLVVAGSDERATEILCETMAAIHKPPPPGVHFPTVEDWGSGFDRYNKGGDRTLAPKLVRDAHEIFRALCRSQGARVLLHGDLHHDNVVMDSRRGWLVIDPKGVVGERAYEVGAALRNPARDPRWFAEHGIIERRVFVFAGRLGEDPARLLRWAFCQAVLSAVWSVEDGEDPATGLTAAAALEPML